MNEWWTARIGDIWVLTIDGATEPWVQRLHTWERVGDGHLLTRPNHIDAGHRIYPEVAK